MPPAKGKRTVRIAEMSEASEEDKSQTKTLAELGALPPTSDVSDDGLVEREVDVLSEPPDIDTTRAEPKPTEGRWRFCLLCLCIPFIAVLLVVAVSGAAYVTEHSNCSATEVLSQLNNISTFSLEADALQIYERCVQK